MKVVILCGGRGMRFNEETALIPKPMIEIGGRPIVCHIMDIYAWQGYQDFILCLGYRGDILQDYFKGESRVMAIDTGLDNLKGSRLKQIERYIDTENFMVTYGDGLADIDLKALLNFHQRHGKTVTITGVRPPSRFGELVVGEDHQVILSEKPQTSAGMINGGFFVFNRKIFDYLSIDKKCDLEAGVLEKLSREGEVYAYPHPGQWMCMDTYRDYIYLNKAIGKGGAFWEKAASKQS